MLATDINNPEFVGSVANPDAALIVEFYVKPIQNIFKSSKEGRAIFEDVIYIRINVPGLKDMQVDRPANTQDQKRFPAQWQHYVNRTQGDSREIGTPLSEWPQLTRSQAEEFRGLKFFTVESVANASDANINALGMIGGMAPFILREKARAFLKVASDTAMPQHLVEEMAKKDQEINMLKEQMAQIAAKVGMATPVMPLTPPPTPLGNTQAQPVQKKRGRPSKADLAARAAQKAA